MVPNARFLELLNDIEPSKSTVAAASRAHLSIRRFLRSHAAFSDRWNDDFLAGSYSRDTAIRPGIVNAKYFRPDVDVFIWLRYSPASDPDRVLIDLRDALRESYDVQRMNKRSIRVATASVDVDVVPLIHSGNGFKVPDREVEEWRQTNPLMHNAWSAEVNTEFEGRFKPFVKLVKWWRRQTQSARRPKGFALEILAAEQAPYDENHYGELFAQFLENLLDEYGKMAKRGRKPVVQDPALRDGDLLSKVSPTDWIRFMSRVESHAEIARKAQDTDDVELATYLWRRLFGPRFGLGSVR
ncbi:SMODS domain-containing nucleotidyltransferase [Mesorhizobium sp. ArgA1]